MVTPQLGIKIIDFGIARLLADNSPRLTLRGHTVGTIAYMSPEQAQGLDVDGRADLYSLGCVLYQLLSGRPPFFSTLPGALLMMQVMDRPTPLDVARPDLPPGLSELVGDLMEKEPAARPRNAARGHRPDHGHREHARRRRAGVRGRPGDDQADDPQGTAGAPGATRSRPSRAGRPCSPRNGWPSCPGRPPWACLPGSSRARRPGSRCRPRCPTSRARRSGRPRSDLAVGPAAGRGAGRRDARLARAAAAGPPPAVPSRLARRASAP